MSPGERSWVGVVGQTGRPFLDSEIQLLQDAANQVRALLAQNTTPSGWVLGQSRGDPLADFTFPAPTDLTFEPDAFYMRSRQAIVAGFPVVVDYTNTATAGQNLIQLDAAPTLGGAPPDVKRSDFVFLEVWLALVSTSPHASGTIIVDPALPAPGDTVLIGGVPLTAVAAAPGVDEFLIGADEITTAANIAAALNDVANSFDLVVSADAGGTDTVTVRAVVAGAAGNAITFAVTGLSLIHISEPTRPY